LISRQICDAQATERRHGALGNEEEFFLAEMDVVARAFAGFVPRHDDRDGATGGLSGEQDLHVEAEEFDRQCLFGRDNGRLQW
jgi:hypothetical protein